MSRSSRAWPPALPAACAALAMVAGACKSQIEYGDFDPGTGVATDAGPWVNATANLAGLDSECGNMSSVTIHPGKDAVIAGIARRGLWVSADGAATFTPIGTGAGSDTILNRPSALIFDPDHAGTYWESGLYNGAAVYRTSDDGATFKQLGDINSCDLVSIDFADPLRQTLLAGGHEAKILFRSSDGGASWTDIAPKLPAGVGNTSFPHVVDAQTFLIGTYSGSSPGLYRSADGGQTWTLVSPTPISSKPVVASDGAIYWVLDGSRGIVRSTDKGATWTTVIGPGLVAATAAGVIELPDKRLVVPAAASLLISKDRGATWQRLGPTLPYTPAGVVYSPFRKAFYAWRFECVGGSANPVPADAIMRLDFDYQAQ